MMGKIEGRRALFPVLAVVCALAVLAMTAALVYTGTEKGKEDFAVPAFDRTAKQGVPDAGGNISYSLLDAAAFQAALCGKPVVEDGKVFIYLTNPESNSVWIKLRILDETGRMVGETGLIRPGEYVETVETAALDMDFLAAVKVQFKLMSYEPDTYRSAGAVSLYTTLEKTLPEKN